MLIAALFGVSRNYDSYIVVFSVATFAIFSLSMVFDTIAVSRLVQIRETRGMLVFQAVSNRLLLYSVGLGFLLAGGLLGLLYILMPIVAAGFNAAERDVIIDVAIIFFPWVLFILPFYAAGAHLKSLWRFKVVFCAELLAMLVSIASLGLYHDTITALPLAYAAGSFLALLLLLYSRGFSQAATPEGVNDLMRSIGEQYMSNQIGSIGSLTDRYFQSHLNAGGISSLSYAGQIINSLSSLMTFRDIYVVPLAAKAGREEKLERMLKGIVLMSVPLVAFVGTFSEEITQFLFQRGRFDAEAVLLTAKVMQIQALSLFTSSLLAPMMRLFQIMDRVRYSHAVFAMSVVATGGFQYLFVFQMGTGVAGIAWATVCSSLVLTIFVASLVFRLGVVIRWLVITRYALYALAISATAALLTMALDYNQPVWVGLMLKGGAFCFVMAVGYAPLYRRIRIILGVT